MRACWKIIAACPAFLAAPALAQDGAGSGETGEIVIADAIRDTYITVVASGDWQPIDRTGQPLSIIGAGEIAKLQGADFARLAERLPGVTLARNGGLGSYTALHVRGANAEQLLVLIDGVRVADAAAPAGGFDFGTLLPAGIGKIELLRGSNSTVWGSDALGGVLAVSSSSGFSGEAASLEFGGPSSWFAQASARHPHGAFGFGLDAAFLDTGGISAAAGGAEPDGLRQWQLGGEASLALSRELKLRAALRHADARLEIDGFPAPDYLLADTGEYQHTRRSSGHAALDYLGEELALQAVYSLSDTRRENGDPALGPEPGYTAHGRNERAELRGRWEMGGGFVLRFGAERAWSRFATLFDPPKSAAAGGAHAQLGLAGARAALNAGIRIDRHRGFGSAWSLGADGTVQLWDGWRIRASYGEGFKAPSLFQLHSDYGNAALRPERSRSFDVGLGTGDRGGWLHAELSLFRRDSEDLIGFVSCSGESGGICEGRPFGTYANTGRARARGVEAELAVEPAEGLRLQGVYSLVEAVDRTAGAANRGKDLARRPRHALTLSADWSDPDGGLAVGADLRVVSGSYDDAANLVRLDGYATATIRASYPVSEAVELFGRIENLWDETYQTAAGYGTPGRSAYLGARARW